MPYPLANILLAIGGDRGNTIPKINVTAGEVALLQAIHGTDSVSEIELTKRAFNHGNRHERARLAQIYGAPYGPKDDDGRFIVDQVYPGAAARVFEDFRELILDESQFKAERKSRAKAAVDTTRFADEPEIIELDEVPTVAPGIADDDFVEMPDRPASIFA